jgi:tRNA-dihydrouridine synthase B
MFKIGFVKIANPFILAPMSSKTNLPFRLIIKKMGASLVTTEMISCEGLTRGQKKTIEYLESDPKERPLAVQLFGADPESMAKSAQIVEQRGLDIVDLNMGCPAKKIVKNGAGAALMRKPQCVAGIVSSVRKNTKTPITVKIRSGWSPAEANYLHISKIIEDCGADAITIHPRYTNQGFSGKADWQIIKNIKDSVHIPVIGSGDVTDVHDAISMKGLTGCDGVMIGREALRNPWIFKQILHLEQTGQPFHPSLDSWRALILQHFSLLEKFFGEKRASNHMRGILLCYSKGLPKRKQLRSLISEIDGKVSFLSLLNRYFEQALGDASYED